MTPFLASAIPAVAVAALGSVVRRQGRRGSDQGSLRRLGEVAPRSRIRPPALIERAEKGGSISPTSASERQCFELLHHLEHAQGFVPCSAAQKRKQRNEIKSLIFELGTPSFFITFSPADIKSPICLYYAGEKIDISSLHPKIPDSCQRLRAIAQNPVMCQYVQRLVVMAPEPHLGRSIQWQWSVAGHLRAAARPTTK